MLSVFRPLDDTTRLTNSRLTPTLAMALPVHHAIFDGIMSPSVNERTHLLRPDSFRNNKPRRGLQVWGVFCCSIMFAAINFNPDAWVALVSHSYELEIICFYYFILNDSNLTSKWLLYSSTGFSMVGLSIGSISQRTRFGLDPEASSVPARREHLRCISW